MGHELSIAATLAILIASASFEGAMAGRNPQAFLNSLTQPWWRPPFTVWIAIGVLFYLVFGLSLYRLLQQNGDWAPLAIAMAIAVLLANGAWNYFFFRRRDLAASYRALLPYALLLAALLALLLRHDPWSALILLPYLAYLPFALAWMRALVRLNPAKVAR